MLALELQYLLTKDLLPESQARLEVIQKHYEELKKSLQPETSTTNAAS